MAQFLSKLLLWSNQALIQNDCHCFYCIFVKRHLISPSLDFESSMVWFVGRNCQRLHCTTVKNYKFPLGMGQMATKFAMTRRLTRYSLKNKNVKEKFQEMFFVILIVFKMKKAEYSNWSQNFQWQLNFQII